MEPPQLNWITNFLWGIADDLLRDLYVEYEPDTDLRDTEQVPLREEGGIEALPAPRSLAARA